MIVRIMTEDQFRLADDDVGAVSRLDDALERAMQAGDAQGFAATLASLIDFVRQRGQVVGVDEVVPSDLIIPAPDMTLDEARARLHAVEAPPSPSD